MNEIPKPASPLPWKKLNATMIGRMEKDWEPDAHAYNEYPVSVAEVYDKDDATYLIWAANNAPKFAARIKQLEAALRECLEMMEDRYDGAEDSVTLWMGGLIAAARKALE